MSKTTPTPAKPTGKNTAAPQPEAAAELPMPMSMPMSMPTRGGSYIRLPDGSLAPDDTTQQAAAPAQEQAP